MVGLATREITIYFLLHVPRTLPKTLPTCRKLPKVDANSQRALSDGAKRTIGLSQKSEWMPVCTISGMSNRTCPPVVNYDSPEERALQESMVTHRFLENPNEHSFAALFNILSPQLVSFFRSRTRELGLAEDLTQEVMLTVYRKCGQVRDRRVFRAWVFKIAHNALYRQFGKWARGTATVKIEEVENRLHAATFYAGGIPTFEFRDWMRVLNAQEQEVMTLRFVEGWEYHEIAAARGVPIGTLKWKVSDCKKKLSKHLGYNARRAA